MLSLVKQKGFILNFTPSKEIETQMTQQQALQLFEEKKVRTVWDDEKEKWFFSIVDVVAVLTDSSDPRQYLKKMRTRDSELQNNWGTICTPVRMVATDGKLRLVDASDTQGILRIIQSIPSPKAEPFKQWMAQVAAQRIDQIQDPELGIDQAIAAEVAKRGGKAARGARASIEKELGHSVVSSMNAKHLAAKKNAGELTEGKEETND